MYEKLTTEPVIKLPALLGFKPAARPAGEAGRDDAELTLGRVVVRDYSNARVLDRLLMYERRIEHSLYRTMGELRKQRLMREMEPSKEGAVPEGGLAGSEPAWGECPRSPKEEVGRGRPTYQEPPQTQLAPGRMTAKSLAAQRLGTIRLRARAVKQTQCATGEA
ncbi:MAG: hypothetical protein NTZ17_02165 [Phycisphaerae bacterium]|nr:hypothetical protein [Phycisphaerae bacterium]